MCVGGLGVVKGEGERAHRKWACKAGASPPPPCPAPAPHHPLSNPSPTHTHAHTAAHHMSCYVMPSYQSWSRLPCTPFHTQRTYTNTHTKTHKMRTT